MTVAGMDAAVISAKCADITKDHVSGSFLNSDGKSIFNFESHDANLIAVSRYDYDGENNMTSQCLFDKPVTIKAYDHDTILSQIQALVPDRKTDRVWDKVYSAANLIVECTDELGYQDKYQRNALGLVIAHTDRNGNTWRSDYDSAKRCICSHSPETNVYTTVKTQVDDASGTAKLLSLAAPTLLRRSIVEKTSYNALSQPVIKTKDFGDGDCLNHEAKLTYDSHGEVCSNAREGVYLDDPSITKPDASKLAVASESTTIIRSNYRNAFKNVTLVEVQNRPYICHIYDSLQRQRYKVVIKVYSSTGWQAQVTEYQYDALNQMLLKIEYASPVVGATAWNPEWFKSIPVGSVDVLGKLQKSSDDRVTFYDRNAQGMPAETYRGVSIDESDFDKKDIKGVVPFYESHTGVQGVGYALTIRDYNFLGKPKCVSTAIDNNGQTSDEYHWRSTAGLLLAKAVPQRASDGASIIYLFQRQTYNVHHQCLTRHKCATPYTDAASVSTLSLSDVDAFIAANQSPKDRREATVYNQAGREMRKIKLGVTRSQLGVADSHGVPSVGSITGDVSVFMSYSPTGVKIMESAPTFKDQPEMAKHYYLDELDRLCARVDTPVGGADKSLLPLTESYLDARGNVVSARRYVNGADPASLNAAAPTPLQPDDNNDPITYKSFNALGQKEIEVDAEGYPTLHTYNDKGMCARELRCVDQVNPGVGAAPTPVIDERRDTQTASGHLETRAIVRDGEVVETTAVAYNAFGDKVSEGSALDSLVLHSKYDQLGHDRISNMYKDAGQRGVACITQTDLAGRKTQKIVSPTQNLLKYEISDLVSDEIYNEAEVSTFYRGPGKGSVVKKLFPTTTVGYTSQATTIRLPMVTQIVDAQYGHAELKPMWIWPSMGITGFTQTLTITLPDGTTQVLPATESASTQSWSADISTLQSGLYPYRLEYSFMDALTKKSELKYVATGKAPVITRAEPKGAPIIPYVWSDSTIVFSGDLSADYTNVILTSLSGTVVQTLALTDGPVVGQQSVDCSKLPSGHYHTQLTNATSKSAVFAPVAVNTVIPPTEETVALSWLINCSCSLIVFHNDVDNVYEAAISSFAESLPPSLATAITTLYVEGLYIADGVECQYQQSIDLASGQTIVFNKEITAGFPDIKTLTVKAYITDEQYITLYADDAPAKIDDYTFVFPTLQSVLLRGSAFTDSPDKPAQSQIKLKDISSGQSSRWITMSGIKQSNGLLVRCMALQPLSYPFTTIDGDENKPIGTIDLFTLGLCSLSDIPDTVAYKASKIPQRLYGLDAFENVVSETDTLGYVTEYEFNEIDKKIVTKLPPINTYAPGTQTLVSKSRTRYDHFDIHNHPIATVHPRGNQDSYPHDSQGNVLSIIDGSGFHVIDYTLDALSRPAAYTRYGHTTLNVFDRRHDIIEQHLPNDDLNINSGNAIVVKQAFNAYKHTVSQTDGCGVTHYMRFSVTGDLEAVMQPYKGAYDVSNPTVSMMWKRHVLVNRVYANGKKESWSFANDLYEYVGLRSTHLDQGGTSTVRIFDLKLQLTRKYNPSPVQNRGKYRLMTSTIGASGFVEYTPTDVTQLQLNQYYTYSAGYLVNITDKSSNGTVTLNKVTDLDYDTENRRIYTRIVEDGVILNQSWSKLGADGNEVTVVSNSYQEMTVSDSNGNMLHKLSINGSTYQNVWFTYGLGDRVLVNQGEFDPVTKVPVITQKQGTLNLYKSGLLVKETQKDPNTALDVDTNYTYWCDGKLKSSQAPGASSNYNFTASRQLASSITPDTNNYGQLHLSCAYQDGLLQSQRSVSGNGTRSTTSFLYDKARIMLQQETNQQSDGSPSFKLQYTYIDFENGPAIYKIAASTSDDYGHEYTQSSMTYHPDSFPRSKDGADDEGQSFWDRKSMIFVTDHFGQIRSKLLFATYRAGFGCFDTSLVKQKNTEYFHSVQSRYLGCSETNVYEHTAPKNYNLWWRRWTGQPISLPSTIPNVGNPHSLKDAERNLSKLAAAGVQSQAADVRNSEARAQWFKRWHFPQFFHNSFFWQLFHHAAKAPSFDSQAFYDQVKSLKNMGSVGCNTTYVAQPGDTYTSIATAYGDPSQALAIAIANHATSPDDPITPETAVTIPSFVPMHYNQSTHTPGSELTRLIIGKMAPHLEFAQPPHHWWDFLLEIIIDILVVVITHDIMLCVQLNELMTAVTAATVAAITDASLQGIAMGLGLESKFNWADLITSAISVGVGQFAKVKAIMKAVKGLHALAWLEAATIVMSENLAAQFIELKTGLISKINWKMVELAGVNSIINNMIDYKMTKMLSHMSGAVTDMIEDEVNSVVDGYNAHAIMGQKFDVFTCLEQGFEQFLGDLVRARLTNPPKPAHNSNKIVDAHGMYRPGGAVSHDYAKHQLKAHGHIPDYSQHAHMHDDTEGKAARAQHDVDHVHDQTSGQQYQHDASTRTNHSIFNHSQAHSLPSNHDSSHAYRSGTHPHQECAKSAAEDDEHIHKTEVFAKVLDVIKEKMEDSKAAAAFHKILKETHPELAKLQTMYHKFRGDSLKALKSLARKPGFGKRFPQVSKYIQKIQPREGTSRLLGGAALFLDVLAGHQDGKSYLKSTADTAENYLSMKYTGKLAVKAATKFGGKALGGAAEKFVPYIGEASLFAAVTEPTFTKEKNFYDNGFKHFNQLSKQQQLLFNLKVGLNPTNILTAYAGYYFDKAVDSVDNFASTELDKVWEKVGEGWTKLNIIRAQSIEEDEKLGIHPYPIVPI